MSEDRPPEGFHYEWVETDPAWSLGAQGYSKCRMRDCENEPVACLMRTRRRRGLSSTQHPWAYCEEHLYGRVIRDGKILHRRLVPDEGKP